MELSEQQALVFRTQERGNKGAKTELARSRTRTVGVQCQRRERGEQASGLQGSRAIIRKQDHGMKLIGLEGA